jgi:hypothetical protein
MSKTTWQETYHGSPRYAAIESVFELIKKPTATVNEIMAKMNRTMQNLNGEERDKLPAFVKAALVDREPVRSGPPNML